MGPHNARGVDSKGLSPQPWGDKKRVTLGEDNSVVHLLVNYIAWLKNCYFLFVKKDLFYFRQWWCPAFER